MQAHFLQLSARDDALSRSLNSDYLAQLYITADVKNMDEDLFAAVSRDAELPPEAKTLLVFKRGCACSICLGSACLAMMRSSL